MMIWRAFPWVVLFVLALPAQAQNPFNLPPRPNGPFEIRGVVLDARTDQALPEVEVTIQESVQPSSEVFEVVESSSNGGFRFANLAEGKYTIRASRQGYAPQAYLQHENFWTGIAVGPGKDSVHLRFPLHPSATITGQVTDEFGEGVRGAEILLWKEELENGVHNITQAESSQTDDEGKYRLEHLPGGKYSVSVTAMPWFSRYAGSQGVTTWFDGKNQRGKMQVSLMTGTGAATHFTESPPSADGLLDVVYPTLYYPNSRDWHGMGWMNLLAGQTESADFHLQTEPSVHIQFQSQPQDAEGGQSRNVSLLQELPGGGQSTISPFTVETESGLTEISGIAAGRYYIQEGVRVDSDSGVGQEMDLQGTVQLGPGESSAYGPAIQCEVRGVEGEQKLEFATAELKDAQGHAHTIVVYPRTDEEGHPAAGSKFFNLPTGPQAYELSLSQPPGLVVKKIEAKGAKVTGTTIETDGAQEVSLVVTVAQVASNMTGVAQKNGKPFAAAMILLMPADHKDWERLVRRDQSDSDGTFRLPSIVPGKYALLALEKGWEMEWSKPEMLQPFLAKAQNLEIGERQEESVTVEVQ
ncbi:MAG TPA: carboxypeptidase-like regulatory domain-containing protein [Candidatus Limnocylindrales bacterium]|nr:carboxypeptidase-like regulatory domain-containing protein [Candidatus Limnocylindrales bacterium]